MNPSHDLSTKYLLKNVLKEYTTNMKNMSKKPEKKSYMQA